MEERELSSAVTRSTTCIKIYIYLKINKIINKIKTSLNSSSIYLNTRRSNYANTIIQTYIQLFRSNIMRKHSLKPGDEKKILTPKIPNNSQKLYHRFEI